MGDWSGADADLVVTDPPFGIEYDGKAPVYNRDVDRVVDGYVEWSEGDYETRVSDLLDVVEANTHEEGQALVFSGWNNSAKVHRAIEEHPTMSLEGKLYWSYNFAPYCSRRPAHNVYEIFWVVKGSDWYYANECSYDHCQEGEANLSTIPVKRDYLKEMPKYPTRLPLEIVKVLVEHYSRPGDVVFDPLAGSGSVGIAADAIGREAVMGDLNEEARDVFETTVEALGVEYSL